MTTTLLLPGAGETRAGEVPARPVRPRGRTLLRGPAGDPGWARPALLGLLVGTAVLYLWGLGQSGWANSFYSAAVQAGSQSWKAFFFGSSDAAELDHRGQDTGRALGDGPVRTGVRAVKLERSWCRRR